MTRILFVVIFAMILLRRRGSWRRITGVTMIAVLAAGIVLPPPAHAQFGLLGGIQSILDIINGAVRSALNTISAVSRSLDVMHQEVIWPAQLINRARNSVASLIARFRDVIQSIKAIPVNSATLTSPAQLESVIRNERTNDFHDLTESYYRAFGTLPTVDQADPLVRNLIDMDDGLALNTLKALKAAEQMGDLILESGNQIENETSSSAPGSAPFLTGAAMAANIQSQATMQRALAAMLRQEAARIAHENTVRKREGLLAAKARQSLSDFLKRP